MAEKTVPVTPVAVFYECDECGEGMMRPDGISKMANPPLYQHTCDKCGFTQMFKTQYPTTAFVMPESEEAKEGEVLQASEGATEAPPEVVPS